MSPAGLTHDRAMELQQEELRRTIAMLRTLSADDWTAQTDCPDWDVRTMYLHVLGACEAGASMRENVRQLFAARKHQRSSGGPLEASLSAVQVRDRLGLDAEALAEAIADVAPRTIRARTKLPRLMRAARMKVDGPVVERWSLGYLTDTIYLRDLWMHRVDAARATGRELLLTADHDGVIVADVVAEWAHRHGRPYRATLHGAAGGRSHRSIRIRPAAHLSRSSSTRSSSAVHSRGVAPLPASSKPSSLSDQERTCPHNPIRIHAAHTAHAWPC